tara:strand:- start:77 stop:283 length:207 start_codon:yes stop_codon:yes gene_type:complete
MIKLEWIEEELSGHLKAEGERGQYWLMDDKWIYLESVTFDAAGPNWRKHGLFFSIDEAKEMAEVFDNE